jgi:hypothetical protein
MSFSDDDEVQVVVQWDAHLKLSPVYEPAFDIFNGKVHKSPPIDTKRTMLLNIVSRRLEEYFLRGTSQATDFEKLKKQCHAGWTSALGRNRVWTMPYTAEKLGLLLVLRKQVNVRASSREGGASATCCCCCCCCHHHHNCRPRCYPVDVAVTNIVVATAVTIAATAAAHHYYKPQLPFLLSLLPPPPSLSLPSSPPLSLPFTLWLTLLLPPLPSSSSL